MVFFDQILHTYTLLHCLDTGMKNDNEALRSVSLAGHGQIVKMLITLEPHVSFHYNILRLSSVYRIMLNNNRQQELCRLKQSYFFVNPKKPLKFMLTFTWVSFLAGISISRDVMQSSKTCTNYIGYLAYNVIKIKITIEPRSGRRDFLAINVKS